LLQALRSTWTLGSKMTETRINGWQIYPHPIFRTQYLALINEARKARLADPVHYKSKRAAKLLMATRKMAFEDIPANPADPKFRQGATLGDEYKHWRRGKFLQQYRLFFRFSETERIVVLAWVNGEETKRAYDSKTDAYRVFSRMLDRGKPPDDWNTLLAEARAGMPLLDDDFGLS
jgi:toxin YhaV